jgi:hypothetical protein
MQATPPTQRWLILSHAFNMDGRAASLTVTDKIPALQRARVEPVVLSACTGKQDEHIEHHQLLPWGPSGLRFDLRHVLAQSLGTGVGKGWKYRTCILLLTLLLAPFMVLERLLMGLKNNWSWAIPAYFVGRKLIRERGITVIYSSGGAYCAHWAASWLKRSTGVTWIAEIHDPMLPQGKEMKTRDDKFQVRLEKIICEQADHVWWFTEGALQAARQRHPSLGERGFCVLPGANPPQVRASYERGPRCVLGHFGSLSETRSLAPVFKALRALLQRRPELVSKVAIEIYGANLDAASRAEMDDPILQKVIKPIGRLEYDPATGLSGRERVGLRMQQVDVLLVVHGVIAECSEYIPSKIYDYFWSGRPVLAFTCNNLQFNQLVLDHQGWVADNCQPVEIERALERVIDDWLRDQLPQVTAQPVSVDAAVATILGRI